jgi:hypothetical protein
LTLPVYVNKGISIIPEGWTVLGADTGDLNKDGLDDIAFVIQDTKPENIKPHDGLGDDTIDENPRVLAIYFMNKNLNKYELQLQADSFIILKEPVMDEPFAGMEIKKGILEINFYLWFSAGSWSVSNHSYKFRFQNEQFELIGFEMNTFMRNSGEMTDYSINFSTGKMSIKKSIDTEEETKESTELKTFKLQKLQSLESLVKPFEWDFMGLSI